MTVGPTGQRPGDSERLIDAAGHAALLASRPSGQVLADGSYAEPVITCWTASEDPTKRFGPPCVDAKMQITSALPPCGASSTHLSPTPVADGCVASQSMRILYLSRSLQLNGRSHLTGREFCVLLKDEHNLSIKHCWTASREAAVTTEPSLEPDLFDSAELQGFAPEVVFSENGFLSSPGSWRLPIGEATRYVSAGGVLIVEGLDRSNLEATSLDDRETLYGFFHARPDPRFGSPQTLPYIRDEASNDGHAATVICHPSEMSISDWLTPAYRGIDSVVASSPVPLSTSGDILATADPTGDILVLDRFVSRSWTHPWASVRQVGHGFAVLIAATVAHDYCVGQNPDNALWLSNVMRLLVDESGRHRALYSEARPATSDIEVGIEVDLELVLAEDESHHVEYKDSASSQIMRDEVSIAVAAFANSDGGTVLVGVADDRTVPGVDAEINQAKSRDAYKRALQQAIGARLDPRPTGSQMQISVRQHLGRAVLAITVARSPRPVWTTPKGKSDPEFYVRSNSITQKLNALEAVEYIRTTFPR